MPGAVADEIDRHLDQHCSRRCRQQEALLAALRRGQIAAAGLDVATQIHFLPITRCWVSQCRCPTAHRQRQFQARVRMAAMAVENLLAGLQGDRLPYCANPEVYD